jgi:anaerobic selenocysteine-containing dehydrogenase
MPDGVTIPLKEGPKSKKWELGLLRKDKKTGFSTLSGKIEFTSETLRKFNFDPLPVYKEPAYSPVSTPDIYKKYPLILITGAREPMYTHSKGRDLPWLRHLMPEPIVKLHPKDAAARDIKNGDMVKISSPLGEITMKARITNILLPGCIDLIHGWVNADVNLIVSRNFDPISGFPPYKEGLCQVTKI